MAKRKRRKHSGAFKANAALAASLTESFAEEIAADGSSGDAPSAVRLAKASDYFTLTPLSWTWTAVTEMNREGFDSMPLHLQEALMDVGKELQRMVGLSRAICAWLFDFKGYKEEVWI